MKKNQNKAWTDEERKFITDNSNMSNKKIAKKLKRSHVSVSSMKYCMKYDNLKNSKTKWTKLQKDLLRNNIDEPNSKLVRVLQRSPKEINQMRYLLKNQNSVSKPASMRGGAKLGAGRRPSIYFITNPKVKDRRIIVEGKNGLEHMKETNQLKSGDVVHSLRKEFVVKKKVVVRKETVMKLKKV